MATTALVYAQLFKTAFNKEVDFPDDTLHVSLHTATYSPDQDTHDYYNDVTNEVSSSGYTAGGAALASVTWTYTAGTNTWALDAADSSWTNVTFTARYAVIYDRSPASDATRPLICYQNFGADQTVSGQNFSLVWNASGIMTITVS